MPLRCIVRPSWPFDRSSEPPLERRLRTVLSSARQTRYYSHPDRRSAVELAVRRVSESAQAALQEVPSVGLPFFNENHGIFLNRAAPRAEPRDIDAHWPATPRVVVLEPWFRLNGGTNILTELNLIELHRLAPQALAGPPASLRWLARRAIEGLLSLPSLRFGVVVFIGLGAGLLSGEDHDLLWEAFQVPVWTQFRGFAGEVLAAEGECRAGLHVAAGNGIFESTDSGGRLYLTSLDNLRHPVLRLDTGLAADLHTDRCDCGLTTPRLANLRQYEAPRPAQHAMAASA